MFKGQHVFLEKKLVDDWIKLTFGPSLFDVSVDPFFVRFNKLVYNALKKATLKEKLAFMHECLNVVEEGMKNKE